LHKILKIYTQKKSNTKTDKRVPLGAEIAISGAISLPFYCVVDDVEHEHPSYVYLQLCNVTGGN
jgi:hypothetical protein